MKQRHYLFSERTSIFIFDGRVRFIDLYKRVNPFPESQMETLEGRFFVAFFTVISS